MFAGVVGARRQHRRVQLLQLLIRWLQDFERQLQYTAPPLCTWLSESAAAYPMLPFVTAVCAKMQTTDPITAWEYAANEALSQLREEDVAPLRALGTQLGKSEAQTQRRCIRETVDLLKERRQSALETARKADKLYMTLGLSGGLAAALLWI